MEGRREGRWEEYAKLKGGESCPTSRQEYAPV